MSAPAEVREAAIADYLAGDTIRCIAERYGYHPSSVHEWLHAAALADYAAGDSLAAVSARYGIPHSTVHRWAQRADLTPTKPDDRFALPPGRWVFSPARRVQVWEAS